MQFEVIVFDVDDPSKDEAVSRPAPVENQEYNQLPSELKTGLYGQEHVVNSLYWLLTASSSQKNTSFIIKPLSSAWRTRHS